MNDWIKAKQTTNRTGDGVATKRDYIRKMTHKQATTRTVAAPSHTRRQQSKRTQVRNPNEPGLKGACDDHPDPCPQLPEPKPPSHPPQVYKRTTKPPLKKRVNATSPRGVASGAARGHVTKNCMRMVEEETRRMGKSKQGQTIGPTKARRSRAAQGAVDEHNAKWNGFVQRV